MSKVQLIAQTVTDVRAMVESMDADTRAQLSPDWLARVYGEGDVDPWTLGFVIVPSDRQNGDDRIGTCGFKAPPDSEGVVEIAYGIAPEHQGKGFATEAAAAMVKRAFDDPQVRIVRAHTISPSGASARVLTKCGFQMIGQVDDPEDGPVWRWEKPKS
jgi:RimJ/RimL family protein N-acetyltransferase